MPHNAGWSNVTAKRCRKPVSVLGRLAPPLGNKRDSLATRPLSRSLVARHATPVAAARPRCEQRREAPPPTTPCSIAHEPPPGGPEPRRPCRPLLVQHARISFPQTHKRRKRAGMAVLRPSSISLYHPPSPT